MKYLLSAALPILLVCAFATFSASSAETREAKRLRQGKITKNEAQHLLIKKFPGAKIQKCELKQAGAHGIWNVELVKAGEKSVTKATVDGRSGKILP